MTELSWFLNAYTLTFAAFMLTAATVGDRWGRRRTMIAGLLVFGAASIAAALSTSSESLIVARAVQGLGAAAMMPLSLTLLAASVPAAKRAMAIGIWGGVSGLGVALGPVVGGAVGTLVLATALIPAYVVWARSRPDAVLPLHLFASRGFSVANVIGPTFTREMVGAVFLLSQYLQVVQGYSPLEAGLRTLPWTAAPMLVAPLAGAVAHRTGLRSLLVAGLSLQAGALVWFAWLTENAEPYSAFVVPLALAGIGMG